MQHRPIRRPTPAALLLCALANASACGSESHSPTDGDAGSDETASTDASTPDSGAGAAPDDGCADTVDLLFVIDNSGSMAEEQENLARQLPRLVQVLASGDLGLDGTDNATGKPGRDFQPVTSLHLGVVSTDMGVGGVPNLKFCSEDRYGDDGLLLSRVADQPECEGVKAPKYQEFEPPADDSERNAQAAEVASTFACVASLGIQGCGFEQQLEAMWKALAPSSNDSFSGGTKGHGDAPKGNQGFLREDSVLAVIHVSDEEDCSITSEGAELFNPTTTDKRFANEGLNVRCVRHADDATLVHPVSRYIEGLKSLRAANRQDRIIFSGLVGVPLEAESLLADDGSQDFKAILALDAMRMQLNGPADDNTTQPVAACESENGRADPARRFVKVASAFGPNGIVRSICQSDFSGALDAIVRKVSTQLPGTCPAAK